MHQHLASARSINRPQNNSPAYDVCNLAKPLDFDLLTDALRQRITNEMCSPPDFRVSGDPDGSFFALAVTGGHYLRGRTPNERAYFVLYFSSSAGFTPFSWMAIASDGTRLSYHRGDELLGTLEFSVLSASVHEGISPRSWFLYPRKSVDDVAFGDARTRDSYWRARDRLCAILRHVRPGRNVSPLFIADALAPPFHDPADESNEIWESVQRMSAE